MLSDHSYEEYITALNRLGLNEDPFSLSANPRFVYLGGQHRNVYYLAQSVIVRRQGLALITGGVGIGKSSLARLLYNEFLARENTIITYIPSTVMFMTHLGGTLAVLFGISVLVLLPGLLSQSWMQLKLVLVVLLIAYHLWCARIVVEMARGEIRHGHAWYRWFNEFPTIVLIAVVILAVVKPS